MPPNTVYVGRPSKWGNPFKIGDYYRTIMTPKGFPGIMLQDNKDVVEYYKYWLKDNKWLLHLEKLKGKNLACWCPLDQSCHADILLKIANS